MRIDLEDFLTRDLAYRYPFFFVCEGAYVYESAMSRLK